MAEREFFIWIIVGICLFVILALSVKLYLVRKAADEIADAFSERMKEETNILIDVGTKDAHITHLADTINSELRTLRSQRHRFQQGDLEIKETITNISHDLRTPLTAIYGYLELLKGQSLPEDARRYLAIIEERADTLKTLTEELFRYSIVTSTSDSASFEPVVLNRQLEESLSAYYAAFKGCHIIPEIHLPEEQVVRSLNKGALSRIFSNILSNALKYSDGDLRVSLSETGDIVFANHASALDSVQAGQLFDRFYTVENAKNSTGLGLSIARALTKQMGGIIHAGYMDGVLKITLSFPAKSTLF